MKLLCIALLFSSATSVAQMVEVQDNPPATGPQRAQEYFRERKNQAPAASESSSRGPKPRYLALHVGSFFSDRGYKWGDGDQKNIGKLNAGVTYRLGEWVNSMDFSLRVDYFGFKLDEGDARKLAFSTIITFPDANSRFPLYFGGGIGFGMFLKQINDESALSFDYQLLAGVRLLDLLDSLGLMVETGVKNHLHLLGNGQFNSVFINVGTVFLF